MGQHAPDVDSRDVVYGTARHPKKRVIRAALRRREWNDHPIGNLY